MDPASLQLSHRDLLGLVRTARFGPPPDGEWTAEQILAHVACADTAISSVALQVAAGERPGYDNRRSLDPMNFGRLIAGAGGLAGLADLVEASGEMLAAAARALAPADCAVRVPVLIVSGDQVLVDEPWALGDLVQGAGTVHVPRHADQLRSLC